MLYTNKITKLRKKLSYIGLNSWVGRVQKLFRNVLMLSTGKRVISWILLKIVSLEPIFLLLDIYSCVESDVDVLL